MFTLPELRPEEVLIYLRKSRTDDPALTVEETFSRHEQMLDDYCRRTWGELVPERNRFREVVSGETIAARPEVQKVLRLIEQPRFRAVLIVEPQRLSRGDLEDIGKLSKTFRFTHTLVLTLQGFFDLEDVRDRDFFERELKRGNDYLEYQKRIMANGRAASIERGNYLGATAPYGYRRAWVKDGKKKAPSLEIEPSEAENVRLMFEMYADGVGATAICKRLNTLGAAPRTAKSWKISSVYRILDNPVYVGMVRWQSTREVKQVVGGELEKQRKKQDDYLMFPGKHEPLISEALWSAVRAHRAVGDTPRVKSHNAPANPFAGLVRCSCGAAVVLWSANPKISPRLRCVERHVCGSSSCRYQDFVAAVAEALKANLENLEVVASGSATPDNLDTIRRLRLRVEKLAEKERSIWEKYTEGMPEQIFHDLLEKTHAEQKQAAELLSAEQARYASRESIQTQICYLHDAIDMLPEIDRLSVPEANRMLKACVKRITYSRKCAVKQSGGNRGGWNAAPIELDIELAF